MNVRLYTIRALSPIHCGTGQSVGGIDLPIAREKPTGIPIVPGSSLKGVLRARKSADDNLHRAVFGPDTANASDHAGSVQFSDANLVFLPARSVKGTFAWVTSPYMVSRLLRDAREAGVAALEKLAAPAVDSEKNALVTKSSVLRIGEKPSKVVFEDFDFGATASADLDELAQAMAKAALDERDRKRFVERVCLVHDDVMSVLLQTCMEVVARNSIDSEKKRVKDGALWTEEALPVESLLSGLVVATPVKQNDGSTPASDDLLRYVHRITADSLTQLGGKASVGRGLCRVQVVL